MSLLSDTKRPPAESRLDMTSSTLDEMPFEEAMKNLQRVVRELEEGDLPLETSIARFEEGMKLAQHSAKHLDSAEQRVEMLLQSSSGSSERAALESRGGVAPATASEDDGGSREEGWS